MRTFHHQRTACTRPKSRWRSTYAQTKLCQQKQRRHCSSEKIAVESATVLTNPAKLRLPPLCDTRAENGRAFPPSRLHNVLLCRLPAACVLTGRKEVEQRMGRRCTSTYNSSKTHQYRLHLQYARYTAGCILRHATELMRATSTLFQAPASASRSGSIFILIFSAFASSGKRV